MVCADAVLPANKPKQITVTLQALFSILTLKKKDEDFVSKINFLKTLKNKNKKLFFILRPCSGACPFL